MIYFFIFFYIKYSNEIDNFRNEGEVSVPFEMKTGRFDCKSGTESIALNANTSSKNPIDSDKILFRVSSHDR